MRLDEILDIELKDVFDKNGDNLTVKDVVDVLMRCNHYWDHGAFMDIDWISDSDRELLKQYIITRIDKENSYGY